ncbi:MAG: choice-of-anchor J domain-containing protein [Clostridia bacterium]|nr:choice-of-anchor J domain-containing protein [Clostridia bacterium]
MRKIIGIALALVMLLSALPMGVLAVGRETAPAEKPASREIITIASWDLETDPIADGWQFIDSDGDGHNWEWTNNHYYSNSGDHSIASASYADGALTPDNWAILPQVEIPEHGYSALVFYGQRQNESYYDIYRVYVGTSDDISSMEPISDDMLIPFAEYCEQVFDLSDYAGQSIYIAIRHYNCSDEWRMYMDDFSVVCSLDGPDDDDIAIHEVFVDGWGTPVAGVAGIAHVFLSTPDDAPYYVAYGGWRDETDQQQMWNESHVFVPGHVYTEGCQIWAYDGYYFADDCVFYANGGTEILDPQLCYVDETDWWVLYLNSVGFVCEGGLVGDVDGDGEVDIADALLALRCAMGLIELTEAQNALADVDGDGGVSIADSLLILRRGMGLIDEFPSIQ